MFNHDVMNFDVNETKHSTIVIC